MGAPRAALTSSLPLAFGKRLVASVGCCDCREGARAHPGEPTLRWHSREELVEEARPSGWLAVPRWHRARSVA